MNKILYYIKSFGSSIFSSIIKVINPQLTNYQYIDILTHPYNSYLGSTDDKLPFDNTQYINQKIIFTSISLDDIFTCKNDQPFFAGLINLYDSQKKHFKFCSTVNTQYPVWYNASSFLQLNTHYHGLMYERNNQNYFPYFDNYVLNIIRIAYLPNSNIKLNFYIPDNYYKAIISSPDGCNCINNNEQIIDLLCRDGFSYLTSAFFYAKYVSENHVFISSVNGYVFSAIKDQNGYFYVNNVCLPLLAYQNKPTLINNISDRCWRNYLPSFAIATKNNEIYYSVSDRLFKLNSYCNITALNYDIANESPQIQQITNKYLLFIADMVVIPNGNKRDFITTHALLLYNNDCYNLVSTPYYYKIDGYAIIYNKHISGNLYRRYIIKHQTGIYSSPLLNIIKSEDFYKVKNIARIYEYDTTNFIVTINNLFAVFPLNVYIHLLYDFNNQSVSIVKESCPTSLNHPVNAPASIIHNNIVFFSQHGSNEIYIGNTVNNGNCYNYNFVGQVNQVPNNGTLVLNDIVIADLVASKYKLVKCDDSSVVIYPNMLSNVTDDMIGKVVNIYGQYDCCYLVLENNDCKTFDITTQYVLVTNIYENCNDCLGIKDGSIKYEIKHRIYRPSLYSGACDPEEYMFIKCKFASAVYAKFMRDKYAIKSCCNENLNEYWVKSYLYDLLSQESDICVYKPDCDRVKINKIITENIIYNSH